MITLIPKTDQEAFDMVVRHLYTMPGRAFEGGQCQYRTRTGNRCAIGALIRDEDYDPKIESADVVCLVDDHYVNLGDLNEDLLYSLQNIHDHESNWDDKRPNQHMQADLEGVARRYDLSTAVIP